MATPMEIIAAVHGTTGAGAVGPLGRGVAVNIVAALAEAGYVIQGIKAWQQAEPEPEPVSEPEPDTETDPERVPAARYHPRTVSKPPPKKTTRWK